MKTWIKIIYVQGMYIVPIDSPTYHRHTSARPLRYHHITSDYLRDSRSDGPTYHLRKIVTTDQSVPNIHGEEFQRVGKTIF